MASRSLLFSTPARGPAFPALPAGSALENWLSGTTDAKQISSCARSWRASMTTPEPGPEDDAPNWMAACTLVQSPIRSVKPSVNSPMQTFASCEFVPGGTIVKQIHSGKTGDGRTVLQRVDLNGLDTRAKFAVRSHQPVATGLGRSIPGRYHFGHVRKRVYAGLGHKALQILLAHGNLGQNELAEWRVPGGGDVRAGHQLRVGHQETEQVNVACLRQCEGRNRNRG